MNAFKSTVRFQGPGGIDVTKHTFRCAAVVTITLSGSSLSATLTSGGDGYLHGTGAAYVPGYTWSGGTLAGGGTPTSGDYPTVTLTVDTTASDNQFGQVTGVSLAGGAAAWDTAPTLTIDSPETGTMPTVPCYTDPPAGTWTVTVSHACFVDQVLSATVVQCISQTLTPAMKLVFTTIHYSDNYGYVDIPIVDSSLCVQYGTYIYTSDYVVKSVACPYYMFPVCLGHQTDTVQVNVAVALFIDDAGNLGGWVARWAPLATFWPSCAAGNAWPPGTVPGVAVDDSNLGLSGTDADATSCVISGPRPHLDTGFLPNSTGTFGFGMTCAVPTSGPFAVNGEPGPETSVYATVSLS